jgi:hypothetical protein
MAYHKGDSKAAVLKRLTINRKFLDALAEELDRETGLKGALRTMRMSHPEKFCTLVATLLPKQWEIQVEDSRWAEFSDENLLLEIERIRSVLQRRTEASDAGDAAGTGDQTRH